MAFPHMTRLYADDYLDYARVPPTVLPQVFGPWMIERFENLPPNLAKVTGWHSQTVLSRHTIATLHHYRGEIVMEDSKQELKRHLPIWLSARGRVLITGLGLGCVVRGLLANPDVEHIDVVEIDKGIMRVIGREFAHSPKVSLHLGDALKFEWPAGTRWDCAWHDIWCEGKGLQFLHVELLGRFKKMADRQGAWMLPRVAGRVIRPRLLGAPK